MPEKPPSSWFEGMSNKIKKGNPDYSDEQVKKTVGDIWYHKMSPSKKREETKKSEGSLKKKASKQDVVEGFADALFNSAWATFEEEKGTSFSGMEITEQSPNTPAEVLSFADKIIGKIEASNNIKFDDFIPPGETQGSTDPFEFGWYLGMEYLGHGVSWADDHQNHGLEVPYGEFTILEHDPENNKYEFWMEGSGKKTAQDKPQVSPEPEKHDEQYRAKIILNPSGDIVYGEWDVVPDTAAAIGDMMGQNLVDAGQALSYKVEVESFTESEKGTPIFGQPLSPDIGDSEWESVLDSLKGSKKEAAGFPNMLSSDAKNWIRLQTTMLSSQQGTPATPEQAQAFIDAATKEVIKTLSEAIVPEVQKVVEEHRDQIFEDITSGVELAAPQAKPAMPIPSRPEIPTASEKKVRMTQQLRKAFDNSYAYDAIAMTLQADLGAEFSKKYKADELIDEEEFILNVVQDTFPDIPRSNLTEAFGDVLTDTYTPKSSNS